MKKNIILLIGFLFLSGAGLSNPIQEPLVTEYSVDPPWIEILPYFVAEGDTFWTSAGPVVITELDPDSNWVVVLDSSNTTGFVLDPDSDSICFFGDDYGNIRYGNFGWFGLPPLPGESVIGGLYSVDPRNFDIAYEFCQEPNPGEWDDWRNVGGDWGDTDLIINEINIHCTWQQSSGFIELFNKGADTVYTNYKSLIGNARLDLPDSGYVAPGEYLVIDEIDFPAGFTPNCVADNLYFVWSGSVLDQLGWSSDHGENVSFMRFPDGDCGNNFYGYNDSTSHSFENGFPSRGAPNRHESPGFVVIGTRAAGLENYIDLYWTNPIWDEMYNSTIAVRNDHHFPESIDDGEVVYQGTNQHATDANLPPERWYFYTVFARDDGGEYSTPTDESRVMIYLGNQLGIDEEHLPDKISYFDAYPNPFNPTTTINYGLIESSAITLSIYNLLGQQVAIAYEGMQDAGEHSVTWDASDFPSGVYFARLKAGGRSENVKMVLIK